MMEKAGDDNDRYVVSKLDEKNAPSFLSPIENYLFDCDGVLYRGPKVVAGTANVVQRLISLGKRVFYISNISNKSRGQVASKLREMGFPAEANHVVTAGYVAALHLAEVMEGRKVFVMGDVGLVNELQGEGVRVVLPKQKFIGETTEEKLLELERDPEVSAVVVGLDLDLTYLKGAEALAYLRGTDLLFVATNYDAVYPSVAGRFFACSGPAVAMMEKAAGRSADVDCGKPGHVMADVIRKKYQLDFSATLMVGDRLDTDIMFGRKNGMQTLLVLTGVSSLQHLSSTSTKSPAIPRFYTDSLADINNFL